MSCASNMMRGVRCCVCVLVDTLCYYRVLIYRARRRSPSLLFSSQILHGLCTMGITANAVLKTFGDSDAANFKALRVRFTKPVMPGQTLEVNMWKEGSRIIIVSKVKETGAVAISNAYMDLQPAAKL